MNKRQICACATGGLDRIITSSKCDTIMDNVYKYAPEGEYVAVRREWNCGNNVVFICKLRIYYDDFTKQKGF